MSATIYVSVVIATYERYKYLKSCIESFGNIMSNEIEFIIHDNTQDNHEIVDFLKGIDDERIRYFHKRDHISMSENYDIAVSKAQGKYICMLGDDDTVSNSLVKAAKYCYANHIDACCFTFPGFNWPDMTFRADKRAEAAFFIKRHARGEVRGINARGELERAVREGGQLFETMPRLYHGMVSKACIDRIYSRIGTCFPGPSPDIANATCVCLEANSTIYLGDYLIVSGYGRDSARGEGNRGEHYGDLSKKKWLPKNILEIWNPDIPAIFSGETIFAQSQTQALQAYGATEYLKIFNYGYLYAVFTFHHRDALGSMIKFCLKKPKRFLMTVKGAAQRAKLRKQYIADNNLGNYIERNDIFDLSAAQKATDELSGRIGDYYKE